MLYEDREISLSEVLARAFETDRLADNNRQEFTAVANWFFAGHNNKITLDYSYLTLHDEMLSRNASDNRFRLQWDISF